MTSQFSTSAPESAPDWVGIDHVQMAIPVGGEDLARSFYVEVLRLTEIPKPAVMAARAAYGSRPETSVSTSGPSPTSFLLAKPIRH